MAQPFDQPESSAELKRWIEVARAGSPEALGRLFEACRQYLLLIANRELPADIQGKVSPSDIVQETFIKAQGNFENFQGHDETSLLAWLRRILVNTLTDTAIAYQGTDKRRVGREVALDAPDAVAAIENGVLSPDPSPSSHAMAQEAAGEVQRVLGQLPELYRQVIHWRNWERRSFEEIGRLTGRSAEAARQLWRRALEQLQQALGPSHESG